MCTRPSGVSTLPRVWFRLGIRLWRGATNYAIVVTIISTTTQRNGMKCYLFGMTLFSRFVVGIVVTNVGLTNPAIEVLMPFVLKIFRVKFRRPRGY